MYALAQRCSGMLRSDGNALGLHSPGNSDRNDDDSHLRSAVFTKAGDDLQHDPPAIMNTTSRDLPEVGGESLPVDTQGTD